MNRLIGTLLLLIAFSSFTYGRGNTRVVNLRCDKMENPIVIESRQPVLQWQLASDERGKRQTAYRIIVSGSLKQLNKGKGDYWDSGKVSSSESVINYRGKPLSSGAQLYWKVMVWDENNTPTKWSEASSWNMGLLKPSDWKAKWIGQTEDLYPDSTQTYPAPYFRKEFAVKKAVKKAVVYVCGLGFYEMSFNGNKIGDQVLAPAVTNYDKRSLKKLLYHYDDQSTQRVLYNVFDVTSHLKKQNNVIGVVLGNGWYNQRDRIVEGHMWYDVPKLILQLEIEYKDGSRETVVSDPSWKTTTGPILHDAIFTGEVYDARLELGSWNREGYDDSAWKPALAVRPPTGALQAQTIPFTKVMGTVDTHFEQANDSLYIFTLPETVSGWCELSVKGRAGDSVKLRFISDEGLNYGQEDVYILKGGQEERWEPKFTWHAFKKIEVIATEGVAISGQSIQVKSIYTDIRNTGSFECSNELFNNICEAYNRTMHANFKGIISSDPHRERLAYTGDGQVITESLLYSYDMTRLLRKFVTDISDASNKNTGYVPHTAPFGGGGGGPAWGSAYVVIPWNYFCHYGDTTLLREHYQGMKHWVEYLQTRTDDKGIVVREEPNGWCLGEWSTPHNRIEIPASLVNTAYFYHVTCIMADVAGILNKKDDEHHLRTLVETIRKNFNAAFYNEATHHYGEGKQGADVFALAFGLVPEGKREKVFAALLGHLEKVNYHFDTGILATPLLLQVLTENGRADLAYKLMNQRDFPSYGYLADKKNNTLWETWNGDGNDEGCGHCHPMFGSVVAWFYHSLAGIKPDQSDPGMKHFYIEPMIVPDLKYCRATYDSQYGKISSDWKIDENGNLNLKIEVPANTSATVIIPDWGGRTVLESGKPVSEVSNIVIDKVDSARMKVSSGVYHFVILK